MNWSQYVENGGVFKYQNALPFSTEIQVEIQVNDTKYETRKREQAKTVRAKLWRSGTFLVDVEVESGKTRKIERILAKLKGVGVFLGSTPLRTKY